MASKCKTVLYPAVVDSGNLLGSGISAMAKPELEALLSAVKPYIPAAELRGV